MNSFALQLITFLEINSIFRNILSSTFCIFVHYFKVYIKVKIEMRITIKLIIVAQIYKIINLKVRRLH